MTEPKKKLTREQKKAKKERSTQLDKEYSLKEPLSKENKKRIAVIAVLAVLCVGVWVWSGIFTTDAPKKEPQKPSTPTVDTNSPVTQAPVTSAPQQEAPQTVTPTPSETPSQSPSENSATEDSLAEAIENACAAVNKAKKAQNFTATKDQEIKLSLTECSIPGIVNLANSILERYGKRKVTEFTFENGVGYDETNKEEVSVMDAIPPTAKDFRLEEAGIASYEVTKDGENTKYVFTLIEESSTLENPVPTYHAMAMDYLDMSKVDIAPAQVTQADFTYPGATVTVVVNPNGDLVTFEEYMPMHTIGAGKLGLTASGVMDGSIDEIWTFNW